MDPEARREYNKVYYELNKERILNNMCEKTICQLCNRKVIRSNMIRHQDSTICSRTQERNAKLQERLNKFTQTN
jgi:hypothetical protein